MAQALAQQAGGHARYAAVQVVKTSAAAQQLAHQQRRPALAQRLGGACDRTKLPVADVHNAVQDDSNTSDSGLVRSICQVQAEAVDSQ
ncbi:hypothetical protein D3C84_966970 [compost metagenome]